MPRAYAIDCETFTGGGPHKRLVSLAVYDGTRAVLLNRTDAVDWFCASLDRGDAWIGANTAFDTVALLRAALEHGARWTLPALFEHYERGRVFDVLLRSQLLALASTAGMGKRYSLASESAAWLGRSMNKGADTWRLHYWRLAGVPISQWPRGASEYAINDAVVTWDVFKAQSVDRDCPIGALVRGGVVINETFQTRAAFALQLMGGYGVAIDTDRSAALLGEYTDRMDALGRRLTACGLLSNGTANDSALRAMVARAYESASLIPELTATGKVKADKMARERLADYDALPPDLVLYGEYKRAEKLIGTYLRPIQQAWRPCRYNTLVETGRTSCQGPNMQNFPARGKGGEIRSCIVPRQGNAFVYADYSTLELRALAQVQIGMGIAGKMAELLQDPDADLHQSLADAGGFPRQVAKPANFGLPVGMAAATFVRHARASYGVKLTLEEAERTKRVWSDHYPEMRKYQARIKQTRIGARYWIRQTPPAGRRAWRIRAVPSGALPVAMNSPFQGLAGDGTKAALWDLSKACYAGDLRPFRPVIYEHDAYVLEGPRELAADAARKLEAYMITGMARHVPDVPIVVEAEVKERWGG